jgi:hypothetical protein
VTTRIEFADAMSAKAGWPVSLGLEQALSTMAVGEGSQATFNPTDTILFETDATPYNSFGPRGAYHVWNYPDLVTGVLATVATFKGWAGVQAACLIGASAADIIGEVDQVAEGHPTTFYAEFLPTVLDTWPQEGLVLIAGSVPDPPEEEYPSMVYVTVSNPPAKTVAHWYVTSDGYRFPAHNAAGDPAGSASLCYKSETVTWDTLLTIPLRS